VQDASNEISCKDTKQNPFVKVPAFTAKSIIVKQNLFLLTFFYLFVVSNFKTPLPIETGLQVIHSDLL